MVAFCNRSTVGIGGGFLQSVNFRDRWWLFCNESTFATGDGILGYPNFASGRCRPTSKPMIV